MVPSKITKCVCHKKTFKEIKEFAKENDIQTVEGLRKERYCSCSCRMCAPYLELMFKSGETEFKPGAYYRHRDIS